MARLGRQGPVVGSGEAGPRAQAAILASQALRRRAERARAACTALAQRCAVTLARGRAMWERAVDLRYGLTATAGRQPGATRNGAGRTIEQFEVEGLVDGHPVTGRWSHGRLSCDPALRNRAQLLVDLGEVFCDAQSQPRYRASLDGPDEAVALTLLRACDRVTGFTLGVPQPGAGGPDGSTPPPRRPTSRAGTPPGDRR